MPDHSPITSLYVHVPFCAKKCEYCAFYSEASDGALINRYVAALTQELEMVASDLRPQTVFFGGGTPSLLNLRQWETIFRAMERLNLLGAAEWTIESNPATVSLDKARLWRDWGVNRVSMGVQSFDEKLLERLGRIHDRSTIFKSFDTLRAAGFDNLNLDLMFAIPGQTMEVWRATLAEAVAMNSEHLACYEVIYEEDTPLFAQLQAGEFTEDEELACAMYDELLTAVAAAGFTQYEVANFAHGGGSGLPTRACRHNVNYWLGGGYHGLGPSASGYTQGRRTTNIANTKRYCESIERGVRAINTTEELPALARAGELAAFGLRLTTGWPLRDFQRRTGFDLTQEWAPELARMVQLGYARLDAERFHLTPLGLRYADWIGSEFLRPQKAQVAPPPLWTAPAERSADGALGHH